MYNRIRYGPGSVSNKNIEGYPDPTAATALRNIQKEERAFRPLVYICSPYAGDVERNTERARAYCRFVVMEHNAIAFAPHLLFPQYLNDDDPVERELAFFMNKVFMGKCTELWVFGTVWSPGMRAEINLAKKRHMIIRYFTEDMQEVAE